MRTAVFVALMALYGLAVLVAVSSIGKPRKPLAPRDVVGMIVVAGFFVAGITYLYVSP